MIEQFYIGTYTHKTSKGVYQLDLNTTDKQIENLQFVGPAGNPTYVAPAKNGKLYMVDKESNGGGVQIFDAASMSLPLSPIDQVIDQDTNPAYITVDENRNLVYTANYHTAEISTYAIQPDGLLKLADRVTHTGQVGPKEEQADGPHPHFMDLTPDNRVVVCDLGLDRVFVYDVDGQGTLSKVSELALEPGFGPRHIVFAHDTDTAYLVGELSSKLAVLHYNRDAGEFTISKIVKTIPDDWTAHNGAAAIRISDDDKYVYVSNRGHNSLAVFEVSENDAKLIQLISSEGDFPRDFNLNQDQSFLILVNQNTDNATLYSRDADTGKLTMIQKDFQVPEGVCVRPE
ncbi:lactonase family protein [Lentilactobacillus sp. SPB1-3]|uniref:Lactonase family protein n=1 Tax=Lentilactobacillus terminaliae TaxID=3003483 RepID=A0ACD5DFI5_9LACO|nr:lactonase family protein [Lentilactobacillus sp. SPB1-3]MCZ0976538.1 lactonase family protein [Lentilactobacillus sp. SPB1-3]